VALGKSSKGMSKVEDCQLLSMKNIFEIFIQFLNSFFFSSFRFDPTIRISFWTMAIGGAFFRTYVGINQSMIQRYMALEDVHKARKCQIVYFIGIVVLNLMCYYNGLLLYATYHDCDPLTTKLAAAKDQMMPLLVMDILRDIPGLSGLFIAGVFSAALSSLSTALNSMSAVVLEDFCKSFYKEEISEKATAIIMRTTVLVIGVIAVALVYVVQHMGSVLQLSMSVPSVCFGPLLGVYVIGLAIPHIGKRATIYGAMSGCALMICFIFKVELERAMGNIKYPTKPTSVEGCTYDFTPRNATIIAEDEIERNFFHISFMYYTVMGMTLVISFAVVYSFIFGFKKSSEIDVRFIAPFLRKYFSSEKEIAANTIVSENQTMYEFKMEDNKL
jgi:solute carrier family 5 (sodium-coupled monocarboxylate transporter), member 8/12